MIGLLDADALTAIDPATVRAPAAPPKTVFGRARVVLRRVAVFAYELLSGSP